MQPCPDFLVPLANEMMSATARAATTATTPPIIHFSRGRIAGLRRTASACPGGRISIQPRVYGGSGHITATSRGKGMEPTGPCINRSGVSRSGAAHRLAPLLQLPLDHLAGGVAGQFVHKDDLPRDLVAGQVLLDVVLDVVLGHLAARAQDDERPQALAELLVVDADR